LRRTLTHTKQQKNNVLIDKYTFSGLLFNEFKLPFDRVIFSMKILMHKLHFQENLKRKQEEVEFNSTKKQEEMIRQMKKKIEELEDEKRDQVKLDRLKTFFVQKSFLKGRPKMTSKS